MSWSKEQVLSFLTEETRLGRLATVSSDGDPHVVPIWFKVDGDRLYVHTMAESRKAKNILATGKFALTVDKDTAPYKGVSIGGRAEAVGNDVVDSLALIQELAVTYFGPEQGPGFGEYVAGMPGEHVTLVLHVDTTESWDYSS